MSSWMTCGLGVFVLIVSLFCTCQAAMSVKAFNQAKGMMEGVCQPRTGVSTEHLMQMRKGEFPESEDKTLKCYFECILRLGNVMRGSKISVNSLRRLARTMLPEEYKQLVLSSIESCQHIDEEDACDTAFAFVKCLHKESGSQGLIIG